MRILQKLLKGNTTMMHNYYSIEAEQAVIGALLKDNSTYDRISDLIKSTDFFDEKHVIIFNKIQSLANENKPFDAFTIKTIGLNDDDFQYIVELVESIASTANVRAYATIIKEKSRERALMSALDECFRINNEEVGIPLNQRIDMIQSVIMSIAEQNEQSSEKIVSVTEMMYSLVDRMQKALEQDADVKVEGYSTGLERLDHLLKGLKPQKFHVIAARPSHGKSSLAMQMARSVAEQGGKVLIFSLEMSNEELSERMMSEASGVSLDRIIDSKKVQGHDWDKVSSGLGRLNAKNLYVVEKSMLSINSLRSTSRKMHRKMGGIDLIVLDYIQLMQFDKQNRVEGISDISRGLKLIAGELNCCVIGLSQLNRKCEDRADPRPILSDLRDSGAIEQDADVVLMIHNQAVRKDGRFGELLVRKNRGGKTGVVPTIWLGDCVRFEHTDEEIAEDEQPRARFYKKEDDGL